MKYFPPNMFSIIHSLLMIQVLSDCKCFLCGEEQQIKENNWLDWEQAHSTIIIHSEEIQIFLNIENISVFLLQVFPRCTALFNWSQGLCLEYCIWTARYIYYPILSRNRERNFMTTRRETGWLAYSGGSDQVTVMSALEGGSCPVSALWSVD